MKSAQMLTTTEAASLAAVAPSTIKRWADQGILPFSRTAGGHRRFERFAVERLLREPPASTSASPLAASWIRCLVEGRRYEIDGRLLEARDRLGSWCNVADELGSVLTEMGRQWQGGQLTIAEEHMASDALARGLARVGDALPTRVGGPRCLLACAGEDEHTLGLALAELCLRELGWSTLWLGRRTPLGEVARLVNEGQMAMVALSASSSFVDAKRLREISLEVGAVCRERGVALVLGGAGAWPREPTYGVRVTSFAAFRDHLG
jgi:excisionase family DNA binding protein